jgi:hypothetical protein
MEEHVSISHEFVRFRNGRRMIVGIELVDLL